MKYKRKSIILWKILLKFKLFHKFYLKINKLILKNLKILNFFGMNIYIKLRGGLGDNLLVGTACMNLKKKFPRLKINCILNHPELLKFNPYINKLEKIDLSYWRHTNPELCKFPQWPIIAYFNDLEILKKKEHIFKRAFDLVKISKFNYKTKIFLSEKEIKWAKKKLKNIKKPIITINTNSNNKHKNWSKLYWQRLVNKINKQYKIIQLGGNKEMYLKKVMRFAGQLSPRKSIAILKFAKLHIGVVSFLMHAANGVNTPSIIIYGGRESPSNSGYKTNKNIYTKISCSPCWLNDKDKCSNDGKCMKQITPKIVKNEINKILKNEK